MSIKVDIQPKNRPETADFIDVTLGEMSLFHRLTGSTCVSIGAADLTSGLEARTIPVSDPCRAKKGASASAWSRTTWPQANCLRSEKRTSTS